MSAIALSLYLASVTTFILFIIGIPLAWWLTQKKQSIYKASIEAIVAMPLVLPPTVLGFYLLILLGPHGWVGSAWSLVSDNTLTFSFSGLVIGSVIYSLPFVVQPLQTAFESVPKSYLEVASTLGSSKKDRFISIVLPLSKRGILTAFVLGFTHTIGEFGVVLMIGGNIIGETEVLSIAIYNHVEQLDYASAHTLSLWLLIASFITLFLLFVFNGGHRSKLA